MTSPKNTTNKTGAMGGRTLKVASQSKAKRSKQYIQTNGISDAKLASDINSGRLSTRDIDDEDDYIEKAKRA